GWSRDSRIKAVLRRAATYGWPRRANPSWPGDGSGGGRRPCINPRPPRRQVERHPFRLVDLEPSGDRLLRRRQRVGKLRHDPARNESVEHALEIGRTSGLRDIEQRQARERGGELDAAEFAERVVKIERIAANEVHLRKALAQPAIEPLV